MRQELRSLQQKLGLTVVYVTHDQTEAMSMADWVVLLNRGHIEQVGTPREIYARPASLFAARFIGTPPMSVMVLDGACINGSTVTTCAPPQATHIAIRPEQVTLGGSVAATVTDSEYLGTDTLVRCRVGNGSEQLTARVAGQQAFFAGQTLDLAWPTEAEHYFDSQGLRTS